jgi:hypothetical protein
METFLFGVYISATVYLCLYATKLDENNYPNKDSSTTKTNINKKDRKQ